MKNNKLFQSAFLAFFLLVLVSFVACNKINLADNNVWGLKQALKSTPQKFSGQAGQTWSIEGNKGTRIHFGPSSFRDNNGNIITNGTIDISLVEMPTAKDMVLNNVTTMVGTSQILQSGGSVDLQVSQNGNPVLAGSGIGIDFRQDGPNTDTMLLFQGGLSSFQGGGRQIQQTSQSSSDSANGIISWFEPGRNPQGGTTLDPANMIDYYAFDDLTHFNYINCDIFYNDARPQTSVSLNLSGVDLPFYSASGYILLNEINAVIPIQQNDMNSLNTISLSSGLTIPIGMKATIIALAKVDGNYYFAKKENETLRSNYKSNMSLNEMTLAEIKRAITNL